jgi:hypothetical protein
MAVRVSIVAAPRCGHGFFAAQLEILLESSFHGIDEIGRYYQNGVAHGTASSFRWSRISTYLHKQGA